MTDVFIPLPSGFQYLNQFAPSQWAPNPSKYRCVTASASMLAEVAYPGRWNPAQLEDELYIKLAGPDVATDTTGIAKQPILDWFHSVNIGYVDLAHLLGDVNALHAEIQAMNDQHIPQLIAVADESKLFDAKTGVKLHSWADQGLSHAFIRVGYSTDQGWAYYYEPAAPGFPQPVPISWVDSILTAGIITCVGIMPHGVPTPPAGFSFQHGTWPLAKPIFDQAKAESTLAAAMAALASLQHDLDVLKTEV